MAGHRSSRQQSGRLQSSRGGASGMGSLTALVVLPLVIGVSELATAASDGVAVLESNLGGTAAAAELCGGDAIDGSDVCSDEESALHLRQLRGERRNGAAAGVLAASSDEPSGQGDDDSDGDGHGAANSSDGAANASDVDTGGVPTVPGVQEKKPDYKPWDPKLAQPSNAPLYEFYLYRATNNETYEPINVNAANLDGVLWYLHHEVVIQYPRKFGIDRIQRFKVQMRATQPLVDLGMHFGPRVAFDRGQCTGPMVCGRKNDYGYHAKPEPDFCGGQSFDIKREPDIMPPNGRPYGGPYEWGKFGYHVGCNNLGEYPFPMFKVHYPDAIWYSLPGPCPGRTFDTRTEECMETQPGGLCPKGVTPTGEGDCTWTYEPMGEVMLDDLVDTLVEELHKSGGREYDPDSDRGYKTSFWNYIDSTSANEERVKRLRKLFATKFPDQTLDEEIPSPECDFNFGMFYKEFWWKAPFGGRCEDYSTRSKCYGMASWGKNTGIVSHPEWYPGLNTTSTLEQFQQLLYMQGKDDCPYRPCGIVEKTR